MFRHTHRWIRSLPAAVWVAALAACGGSEAPPPPAPPPVVGAATLGPAGGSVDGPDGVRLDVPAGALAGNVTFRIARDAGAAPPLPGGTEVVGHVYEITPHGEDFGAGAAVRLPVDVAAVGDRQAFLMKASPGGAWQILAPVERGHNVAHAAIASLSYLAVGVCTPNPGGITQSNLFFEVCPASSSLRWELLDGSGVAVPVPQPPNGSPQPVLLVTQPTTLTLRLSWTRPAGLNRVDELDTGSGRDGPTVLRTAGFTWGSGAPRLEQVNGSVVRSFTVAVDPASIAGAGAPNGVVRNLWAQARYRFQPLPPLARVDWSYDAFIPIRVRYLGTQPTLVSGPTPESVSVVENATFQLAVQATGPGLTIQWRYFTGVNDATGAPAEGTNNQPTYQSPPVPLAWNGRLYYARLCATSGSPAVTNCIDSPASPLTVRPFTEQATFTTHPVSRSVIEGETVDFTAAARGTPTPTLRWVLDRTCSSQLGLLICSGTTLAAGPVTSGKLAGATIDLSVPDRLRITNVPLTADGATLTAVASQTGFPNVASNPATLGVSARPVVPSITTPLAPQSITAGGTATYTVGVAGTEPLTLQWTLGGTPLANGAFSLPSGCSGTASVQDNGRRLVLTGVSPGCDGLTVTVRVTNAAGGPASSSAALNVSAAPAAPAVTAQPGDVTVSEGARASVAVGYSGTAPITLTLQRFAGGAWTDVASVGSAACASPCALQTPVLDATDNGAQFRVRLVNAQGSALTNAVTVTVTIARPPAFTAQPASVAVDAGQSATFSFAVGNDTGAFSYQWLANGQPLADGSNLAGNGALQGATVSGAGGAGTSGTLTLANVPLAANGVTVTVRVTRTAGGQNAQATSQAALLTVNTGTPPNALTATQVYASNANSLVVRPDGTVWGWGVNVGASGGYHEPGLTPWQPAYRPVRLFPSVLTDVRRITGALNTFFALRGDGTVWHWGRSDNYIDGRGADGAGGLTGSRLGTEYNLTPVQMLERRVVNGVEQVVPLDRVCTVAYAHGIVVLVRAIDHFGATTDCNPASPKTVWAVGRLFLQGPYAYPTFTMVQRVNGLPEPTTAGNNVRAVFGNGSTGGNVYPLFLAQTVDGRWFAWGNNYFGNVGVPAGQDLAFPTFAQIPGNPWGSQAATVGFGSGTTFMVRADGSVAAAGIRSSGTFNLGDGEAASAAVAPPVPVLSPACTAVPCASVMDGATAIGLSDGRYAGVVVRNGELYGWGGEEWYGTTGVVSNAQFSYTRFPNRIGTLTGVAAVAVGLYHALAIGPGNVVYVWGYDGYGLGLAGQPTAFRTATPTMVTVP